MKYTFSQWLQLERERRGLTQARLAKLAGIGRSVINKIENGISEPQPKTLQKIARALNIPEEMIFEAAGTLKPSNHKSEDKTMLLYYYDVMDEDKKKILLT